uniref:Uncharacterized protein n=1 Tax=Vitis vinifera TaxID=29760 RepID=F6HF54_VITVI
MVAASNFYSSK